MSTLDLFSIGAWTVFDHMIRMKRLPREGETVPMDMPIEELEHLYFGDCSGNIAAAAAKVGLNVGLGMVVGADFDTGGYRAHMERLGVDLGGVEVRKGARSGHSYNFFDFESRGYCISHLGVAADQSDWEAPLADISRARALVVSEMFSPYTLAGIEHAKANGILTAINGMVATAGPLAARFLAAADLLFLSRGEAADLRASLGASDDREILHSGPRLVVVTRGTDSSAWHEPHGTTLIPSVPAAGFVDSTGAGDSFVGGALLGTLRGLDTLHAGRCAATVASFVVEAWGCQTNLPSLDQVKARYRSHFGEELPL